MEACKEGSKNILRGFPQKLARNLTSIFLGDSTEKKKKSKTMLATHCKHPLASLETVLSRCRCMTTIATKRDMIGLVDRRRGRSRDDGRRMILAFLLGVIDSRSFFFAWPLFHQYFSTLFGFIIELVVALRKYTQNADAHTPLLPSLFMFLSFLCHLSLALCPKYE